MMILILALSLFAKNPSIDNLKRELEGAEKHLIVAQERVSELNLAIASKEISRIENLVQRSTEKTAKKKRIPEHRNH